MILVRAIPILEQDGEFLGAKREPMVGVVTENVVREWI